LIREAQYYSRMALGVHRLLRQPLADPEGELCLQLEQRAERFLDTARAVVFSCPSNPYFEMFRLAGCSFGDLETAVRKEGLEATLRRLAEAGVYLTHDEFKGKTPVIRAGRQIPSTEGSYVNPLVTGLVETASGGSRSQGTRTRHNIAHQVYKDAYEILLEREFALNQRVRAELKPILPSGAGLHACLRLARRGIPVDRWFSVSGTMRDSGHYRAVTRAMVLLARLLGVRVPMPCYLPPNDFSPAARWLAQRRAEGRPAVVTGYVSPAVRVATAAAAAGLDIRGTLFLVSGEALTDTKRAAIEAAGVEVFPFYWIHEFGPIGFACRQMRSGNCVHLFSDSIAAVSRRRRAPLSEAEVESLLFTSLLPFAPRFLINAEMDDTGILGPAECDCVFSRMGLTTQIRQIASYGKLTGQGITLFGTDLVEILESSLPGRFGGAPGDYQLVESEAANQTKVVLRVSPRLGVSEPGEVKAYFLEEVRRRYGGALAVRTWQHADGVEAVIAEPAVTMAGKVLSLHLLGSGGANTDAA
jgi:hypothetical protein